MTSPPVSVVSLFPVTLENFDGLVKKAEGETPALFLVNDMVMASAPLSAGHASADPASTAGPASARASSWKSRMVDGFFSGAVASAFIMIVISIVDRRCRY
jgi:hypothetical protein